MQIAPSRVRGALGSINQLVICIGIVSALVVNVVLPATSWRTMFYLASLPALLLGLGKQPLNLSTSPSEGACVLECSPTFSSSSPQQERIAMLLSRFDHKQSCAHRVI